MVPSGLLRLSVRDAMKESLEEEEEESCTTDVFDNVPPIFLFSE